MLRRIAIGAHSSGNAISASILRTYKLPSSQPTLLATLYTKRAQHYTSMPESFPNAENAFLKAFTQPNPVPKLLDLIQAHPQRLTITDLVFVYSQLAAERPTEIEKFAKALVKIRDSNDVTVAAADNCGNPAQVDIGSVLNRVLAELHSNDLVVTEYTPVTVTPSNDYLVASILSAISMKYRLTDSPAQAGSVAHGLHYKDKRYRDPPASREILVLGSSLQLLIAGSYLYGPEGLRAGKDDVSAALEAIQEESVVKTPNGKKLLSAAIEHAKSGFRNDLDIKSAWSILFP